MKIYLAARYSRRDEMREIAAKLEQMGHVITSQWLDTNWEVTEKGSSAAPAEYREEHSAIDMGDVKAANCIISFTEEPRTSRGRGGRHVEHGLAAAWGHRLVVVGYRENLFHHLPGVEFHEGAAEMLASFAAEGSLAC